MLLDRGVAVEVIPHLDRFLVRWLFNHPRDTETGRIKIRPKGPPRPTLSPREEFFRHWRRYGVAAHRVEALWELHAAARGLADAGVNNGRPPRYRSG